MPKHPGSLQLQPRDIELLRGLFESRLMTIANAAEIHFGGRREAAKKRIQRLKAAGFVKERQRRPYEPSILHLASKGVTALSERSILVEYPPLSRLAIKRRNQVSERTLRHELQVMDVKAALYRAMRATPEVRILSFCTWPLLNEFYGSENSWSQLPWIARPDGLLRISRDTRTQTIFLELDRSTESLGTLLSKVRRYASYKNSLTGMKSMTIQFVFPSETRRRNADLAFASIPRKRAMRIRTSTLNELLNQPLSLIKSAEFE